ncbi:MAG: glycosyltransferase [bacterium]
MNAQVSVVIPVFNTGAFLARCLDSVIGQTFQSIEVICVNDGSTDRSLSILQEYQKKDGRIRIVDQTNQGAAVARNHGLQQATADFIYYLDSDDVMHPQLLEYTHDLAVRQDAELVCFDWQKVVPGQVWPAAPLGSFADVPVCQPKKPLHHLHKGSSFQIGFNSWSKLFRRSLAQSVAFIPGNMLEDYPHTACVLRDNPRTIISSARLYYYTLHEASITRARCTPQKIRHYHEGLLSVLDHYRDVPHDLAWLRRHLFPHVLKHQLNQITSLSSTDESREVRAAFRTELQDLDSNGLLRWSDHKLRYYVRYKYLLASGA